MLDRLGPRQGTSCSNTGDVQSVCQGFCEEPLIMGRSDSAFPPAGKGLGGWLHGVLHTEACRLVIHLGIISVVSLAAVRLFKLMTEPTMGPP